MRIPDVRVRKGQRARIAAFRRALRLGLVDDRRIVPIADAELQAAQLVRRALGIRHREVEADAALAHGQVVFKAFGRERVAQLAVRIAQGQRADLQAVTINGHFPVPGQTFHIGHRQGRAHRIRTQTFKGHAVRIAGIHVRDGHGPGQGTGRLRDRDLGGIIAALDGNGDGFGDLVAGAVGDGDLAEALGHGLTIRQMVHVLRQLIPVLAGLGIKVQSSVLSRDHLPDLAVDGHRLGALCRIMQRIVMGPVRAAVPAFGCDVLLRRGFRLFRHIDRQAPLVGYLRHTVAALDVDREFLFGDAAVAVIHHHGDLGIHHIRGTQILYRIQTVIQHEAVLAGHRVDREGTVVGLADIFARFFRERPILQGIAQRIALIHVRGGGCAADLGGAALLDGQYRRIQRKHRSIVGAVDGDGDVLCHLRTVLVLDEDGEGLLQGLAVFSQFLYCLHLVVELIAVGTVRIDEKGTVLPGSHIAGVAACCALTGSHGIAQIAFIYAVVRDVELVPDRDGGIFRGLKRELTAIDHRGFVGTRDGDVEIFLRAAVGSITAVVHSNGQVKVRILSGQQLFSFGTGLEGVAAVLVQRELAPVGTILGERIGAGGAHCLTILGSQGDA